MTSSPAPYMTNSGRPGRRFLQGPWLSNDRSVVQAIFGIARVGSVRCCDVPCAWASFLGGDDDFQ
jgi:hypothetical protein